MVAPGRYIRVEAPAADAVVPSPAAESPDGVPTPVGDEATVASEVETEEPAEPAPGPEDATPPDRPQDSVEVSAPQ
jgi:hypothetical protein